MKFKIDFVSNSSCASFVIPKYTISQLQIDMIKNHIEVAKAYSKNFKSDDEYGPNCDFGWLDPWTIKETKKYIEGETSMDNFDMLKFLLHIGIDEDNIKLKGCYE